LKFSIPKLWNPKIKFLIIYIFDCANWNTIVYFGLHNPKYHLCIIDCNVQNIKIVFQDLMLPLKIGIGTMHLSFLWTS